jgi:hypothetical protein
MGRAENVVLGALEHQQRENGARLADLADLVREGSQISDNLPVNYKRSVCWVDQ